MDATPDLTEVEMVEILKAIAREGGMLLLGSRRSRSSGRLRRR
jgi:hypothetical protein